jgi:heptosyltransferase-2
MVLGKNLKEQLGDSVIDITGQTTLRQTVALFKRCHLFIGTDSGTKHLAAGAGLPTIEISWSDAEALTIPNSTVNRFRPWQVPYRILSPDRLIPPCSRECSSNVTHCIRGVRAELVAESALQALHERAGMT